MEMETKADDDDDVMELSKIFFLLTIHSDGNWWMCGENYDEHFMVDSKSINSDCDA